MLFFILTYPLRSFKRGFQGICGVDTCCGKRSCVLQLMLKVNCFCPFFQESPSPWSPWYPNKDVFQTSSMCTMYSVGYYCRLWTFYIACKAGHCYQSAILEAWNENLWQQWQRQRKRRYWLLIKRTMKSVHNPCQRLSKRRNLKKKTATFIKFGQFSSRKRYHLLAPLGFKPISWHISSGHPTFIRFRELS